MDSNRDQDSLAQLYSQMSDLELRELHADEADLTDNARAILRDEIRKRKLDLTRPIVQTLPDDPETSPVHYTWKTDLFTFRNSDDAYRTTLALKRAGIESFLVSPQDTSFVQTTVQVAADQLEEARAVLAQLSPEMLRAIEPEGDEESLNFKPPSCPRCNKQEAFLLDTEPVNRWQCDACGFEWDEPTSAPEA